MREPEISEPELSDPEPPPPAQPLRRSLGRAGDLHDLVDLIDGLRAVAAFYESHPDAYYDGMTIIITMYASGWTAGKTLAGMADIFGECDRTYHRDYISVAKNFSPKVKLEVFARMPY